MCVIGVLMGGFSVGFFKVAAFGVGTIITAFFMGPLIDFFREKEAKPVLYGKKLC